jgi:hypothetical protein
MLAEARDQVGIVRYELIRVLPTGSERLPDQMEPDLERGEISR